MPIPSFRHLDDGSIVLDEGVERQAGDLLAVVRAVYREVGPGLKEGTYQEAMEIALADAEIPYIAKPALRVLFRGRVLRKRAVPDLLIGDHIVAELKAVEQIHIAHHAQVVTYLRVSRRPLGSILNFNAPTLSEGIKRKVLTGQ